MVSPSVQASPGPVITTVHKLRGEELLSASVAKTDGRSYHPQNQAETPALWVPGTASLKLVFALVPSGSQTIVSD